MKQNRRMLVLIGVLLVLGLSACGIRNAEEPTETPTERATIGSEMDETEETTEETTEEATTEAVGENTEESVAIDEEEARAVNEELYALFTGYTPEQAEQDGCIVERGKEILAGRQIWLDFVAAVERGESASVLLYRDHSDCYYVEKLIYNGEQFHRYYLEMMDREIPDLFIYYYDYLIHEVGNGPMGEKQKVDGYLLSNREDATLKGYFGSIVSSDFEDRLAYSGVHLFYAEWEE